MLRLFWSTSKYAKKIFKNDFQLWWSSEFFSIRVIYRSDLVHSPAHPINKFSTCQWFLKSNLENNETFNSSNVIIKKDGTVKKKKKPVGVRVYLLNEKGISSSLLLHDAEKLAKRQGLELKKVEEINGTPAYKLIQFSDLLESELPEVQDKRKKEKVKKLLINADINSHDLHIKINHINRFLDKGIRVLIKLGDRSSDSVKLSAIYDELQKSLPGHSIGKLVSKSGYHINIVPKEINTDSDKTN